MFVVNRALLDASSDFEDDRDDVEKTPTMSHDCNKRSKRSPEPECSKRARFDTHQEAHARDERGESDSVYGFTIEDIGPEYEYKDSTPTAVCDRAKEELYEGLTINNFIETLKNEYEKKRMDDQVQREGVKKSYARMFTAPDFSNLILSDDAFDALSSEDEYGEDEDSEYPKQPDFGDDIIRASFRTNQKADASSSATDQPEQQPSSCALHKQLEDYLRMLNHWFSYVVPDDTVAQVLDMKNVTDRLETICLLFQLVVNLLVYTIADSIHANYTYRSKVLWRNSGIIAKFWKVELEDYINTLIVFNAIVKKTIVELDYSIYSEAANKYIERLQSPDVSKTRVCMDPFSIMRETCIDSLFKSLINLITNTMLYDDYVRRELVSPIRFGGYESVAKKSRNANLVNGKLGERLSSIFSDSRSTDFGAVYGTVEELRNDRRRLYSDSNVLDNSLRANVELNSTIQRVLSRNGSFVHLFSHTDSNQTVVNRITTMHMLRVAVSYTRCVSIVLSTPLFTERTFLRGDVAVSAVNHGDYVNDTVMVDNLSTVHAYATSMRNTETIDHKLYPEMVSVVFAKPIRLSMRYSEITRILRYLERVSGEVDAYHIVHCEVTSYDIQQRASSPRTDENGVSLTSIKMTVDELGQCVEQHIRNVPTLFLPNSLNESNDLALLQRGVDNLIICQIQPRIDEFSKYIALYMAKTPKDIPFLRKTAFNMLSAIVFGYINQASNAIQRTRRTEQIMWWSDQTTLLSNMITFLKEQLREYERVTTMEDEAPDETSDEKKGRRDRVEKTASLMC